MTRNVRKSAKHIFAAMLCCLVMSAAIVCFADEKGTVTVESAKVREQADPSSSQAGSVAKGGTVDIVGETTGADGKKWYEVSVNANLKGYIRADLISKNGGGTANAGTTQDAGANAAVTSVDAKQGTVTTNSVYVRKSASTNSADIATVSKGIVLTVTGEAKGNDGKKWYQVTFKHNDKEIGGFIRADLVTFENVPADPAVSEITGTGEGEGDAQPETQQPQEETPEPPQQADNSGADENEGIIFINVEEEPYIMPGFELVALDWNGQKINAYRNGTFFIVYAQKQNGEEGWYILDREKNIYQRYPYTVDGATAPKESILSGSPVPMIVMAAVIVVMLIIIVVLFLKLKSGGSYYEDDDYPDDDDDDDIEEIEEDIVRIAPARRQSQPQGIQPARRPIQPQQRPQERIGQVRPDQPGSAPVRRPMQPPQGQGQQERPVQTQPSVRRPVPQERTGQGQQPGMNPARRPMQPPQGQGQQERPAQRRPAPQSGRPVSGAAPQKGRGTRDAADKDDDDMNFVDV